MTQPRRVLVSVALAALSALVLSGCLSLAVSTSVSATGTFTGDMTTTFDRQAVQDFGIADLSSAQQQLGAPDSSSDNVVVQWSESDTAFVQTVTFTDATPEQIEQATSSTQESTGTDGTSQTSTSFGFPLTAEVAGDSMVVSLSDDTESAGSEAGLAEGQSAKAAARIGRMLFGDSSVSIEITMPGPITDVTGVIPEAAKTNPDIVVAQPDPTRYELGASFVALGILSDSVTNGEGLVITSSIDTPAAAASASTTASPDTASAQPGATASDSGESAGPGPVVWVAAAVGLIVISLAVGIVLARRSRTQD